MKSQALNGIVRTALRGSALTERHVPLTKVPFIEGKRCPLMMFFFAKEKGRRAAWIMHVLTNNDGT